MTPAQHAPGQHLTSCSSPENCAEYLSVLSMTPTEHHAWLVADRARLRTASSSRRTFRVSHPRPEQEDFTPPSTYAADIAKQRERDATPESRVEDRYREQRRAEFAAQQKENR